ncbi:Cof-type HAD-IIB family hydrolase [Aphanothece hegewaldii CCALA 016]|uniref:Cof-type HAD-IIB family hydrolase n=1 Tax=Aphanothece hegewaldii CCALA 016 TaxID=2107694 RepID=A0A2T1LY57_9CHRO|nr:Cof-type HAD-IIB family hydrolase [Aphanothece hegewaldii]PSF37320.1 Cof-type HAD-IIB family hydrolase [Aphanothece hegewaldii CCALA 016]
MDIRLLALDLDGTIVGHNNQISERVQQAIQTVQAKGVQVAIATGRMYKSAYKYHQTIASELPLIAYNGALIQDPKSQKILYHLPVALTTAKDLIHELEQPQWRSKININLYINDQLYVSQINDETKRYAQRSNIEAIAVGDLITFLQNNDNPTKILAIGKSRKVTRQLMNSLQQRFTSDQLYLTQSTPIFLEATHQKANKGTGVYYLAEQILGLKAEQVMTIGDNFNDVSMLSYAGMSVVMGNAPDAVKEFASWVAPPIELDGVAVAIEKFLL